MNSSDPSVLKIISTYVRSRWVFKKMSGGKLGNVGILKRFHRSAFSICILWSPAQVNFFEDLWLAGCIPPWMPRGRLGITRQRKQKACLCVKKIIYIFCGSFYDCDSLAYGVGVMWKISNKHWHFATAICLNKFTLRRHYITALLLRLLRQNILCCSWKVQFFEILDLLNIQRHQNKKIIECNFLFLTFELISPFFCLFLCWLFGAPYVSILGFVVA